MDTLAIGVLIGGWAVFSAAMTVKFHGKPLFWLDFPTLLIVIMAALDIGAIACFNIDPAALLLGPHSYDVARVAIGISGVWQFFRQRYW